jgi:hypothetical protein
MKPMNETFWMIGEPDNFGGKESCSSVIVNRGQTNTNVMSDTQCTLNNRFICGVRNFLYKSIF